MSALTGEGLAGTSPTFDRGRADGGGPLETARNLRTALLLGWRVESNWTDPVLFFIYTVARPIASLLLLVVMVTIIGGAANQEVRTFVVLGSALWAMLVAGLAGPAWSVLEDRERYRMLKYLYVSPATFLVLLVGRGGARLGAGAMGTAVALVFAVIVLGLRVDLAAVDWLLLVVCLTLGVVPILGLGVLLAAICLQTRQESWSYPDAFAGALFLVSGVVFPAVDPAPGAPGRRPHQPDHLVGRRRPAGLVPDGPSSIGGPGSVWTAVTGTSAPDGPTIVARLVRDRGAGYTRGHRHLPIRANVVPGNSGCWTGRPARSAGGRPGGEAPQRGELMRIYDGSPRQDFEEVFRSIGAFLDSRGMRDILIARGARRLRRPGTRRGRAATGRLVVRHDGTRSTRRR